jgi:DNA-directed RNA polymerase subunit F
MKVNSTSPASVSKIKELLEKRADAEEELGYEQQNALEHGVEFAELTSKKVDSLAAKLKKEFPALSEEAAFKMAEILPPSVALVRMIASNPELSEEDAQKIISALKG